MIPCVTRVAHRDGLFPAGQTTIDRDFSLSLSRSLSFLSPSFHTSFTSPCLEICCLMIIMERESLPQWSWTSLLFDWRICRAWLYISSFSLSVKGVDSGETHSDTICVLLIYFSSVNIENVCQISCICTVLVHFMYIKTLYQLIRAGSLSYTLRLDGLPDNRSQLITCYH